MLNLLALLLWPGSGVESDVEAFPIDADVRFVPVPIRVAFVPTVIAGRKRMSKHYECTRGDTGLAIAGAFECDGDELPDLTGATVTLSLGEVGEEVVEDAAVEIVDALTLAVNYDLNNTDFGGMDWQNVPVGGGTYRLRWKVVRSDGAVIHPPTRAKDRMFLTIREP